MDGRTLVDLGAQRFDKIRGRKSLYIDKTGFIKEWWEYGSDVTLITRPRRFGKTLNLSMTECFFSNRYADRGDLFQGLSIWEEEKYRKLQGTFPVIFISFANIKAAKYEDMAYAVTEVIAELYEQNKFLLEGEVLSSNEKNYFERIQPGIEEKVVFGSVNRLSNFLKRFYGREVIILLDEYDTPMQEAWLAGYWDQAAEFFRSFFNHTLKTNNNFLRGLITGITRVAKESIFSDLNNMDVITTTSEEYAACFGFTEEEVFRVLDDVGLGGEKQNVKSWYDGFSFGTYRDIYNPWSIMSFVKKGGQYNAYWTDTSSNGLVNSLIQKGAANVKKDMEALLQGKCIKTRINEQIVFSQLDYSADALWSLLLATGYLKVEKLECVGRLREKEYTLALTNMEVESMFKNMVKDWFGGETAACYNEFICALLNDNVRKMNTFMNRVALETFSAFDSGSKPSKQAQPERFYHGFVLGMVVNLSDRYQVCSNRESGYGRYDVIMKPYDKTDKAFIFEFKVIDLDEDEKTLEDTLLSAHAQIDEKKYEAELIAEGYLPGNIRKYGFAFQGKRCLIG